MDTSAFDRIARILGGAATRRAGLGAAAAALIGTTAPAAARPGGQSQCGGRKSSTCEKDGDCCSGRCNLQKGKTNKDGLGRCRCSRRNEECGSDRDCCSRKDQGLVCLGGVCSPPCLGLNSPCTAQSTCCAGECVTPVAAGERAVEPYCCIPLGKTGCKNDGNCCYTEGGAVCENGTCVSACKPLQAACSASVDSCCAGNCSPYTWPSSQVQAEVQTACCLALGESGCGAARDCCASNNACDGGQCKLA